MSKEYKHYELRSVKRPIKSKLLLSTVAIRDMAGEERYCYAAFSEKLIQAVGRGLPRGISEEDPAFLHVVFGPPGVWAVWAQYLTDGKACKLWRTADSAPPSWLKFYKHKVKNGNPETNKTC